MRWFTIAALALLAICYLGILLAPHLSVHLATDPQEPGLAGNWRGAFGHKNDGRGHHGDAAVSRHLHHPLRPAGYPAPRSSRCASLFLLYSAGKSSLTLCFAVLLLTSVTSVVRSFWLRAIMLLTPLLLLNMLSVGTVMSEGLAEIAKLLPLDSTFTGRTDIWTFALQSLHARLLDRLRLCVLLGQQRHPEPAGRQGMGGLRRAQPQWLSRYRARHGPARAGAADRRARDRAACANFQRADEGGNNGPLAMVLLRIWLFGLYLSSMESFFLDRADPLWFTFLLAVFGLHYLARFRARRRERSELRPHRFGDILPPAVEIERQVHRRPFQRRDDPVGIGLVISAARDQHDGAAVDQFLEARMMIEFLRQRGAGDDQRRPDCTQVRMLERRAVSPSSSG